LSDEVLKAGKESALEGAKREPKVTAAKKAKQN
jgi:TetR/AcrR family transcriptional repressor of nem operon